MMRVMGSTLAVLGVVSASAVEITLKTAVANTIGIATPLRALARAVVLACAAT